LYPLIEIGQELSAAIFVIGFAGYIWIPFIRSSFDPLGADACQAQIAPDLFALSFNLLYIFFFNLVFKFFKFVTDGLSFFANRVSILLLHL
jgi:hypothetical protein